jgi:hypothetical protein
MIRFSTIAAIAIASFLQGCGGGGGSSSSDEQTQQSLFENAVTVTANSSLQNIKLNAQTPTRYYTIIDVADNNDTYVKVTAPSSNKTSTLHNNIYTDTYDGDTFLERTTIQPGFTRMTQMKKLVATPANFLITGADADKEYTYTLQTYPGFDQGLVQDTVTLEPNDFKEIAVSLDTNKTYDSRVVGIDDPVDWYVLKNAVAGKDYYLQFLPDSSNPSRTTEKNMYIEYYDDYGKLTESAGKSPVVAATGYAYNNQIIAQNNGNLYIKVRPQIYNRTDFDSRTYKYEMKAFKGLSEGLHQDATTYEPNNYKAIAYPISLDQNISSRVYGRKSLSTKTDNNHIDQADWFSIENISQNETYTMHIAVSSENPSGVTSRNLYLDIYDKQGDLLSKTLYTSSDTNLTLTPTMDGELYIKISAQYNPYLYKYNFSVTKN